MNVPDTYAATCLRAAELADQGRYGDAFELHQAYRHKATQRGDRVWHCDCPSCSGHDPSAATPIHDGRQPHDGSVRGGSAPRRPNVGDD